MAYFTAAAAGAAAGLLYLGVLSGSALGLMLIYVAPLPLFLVGLGQGVAAAAVAGAVAMAVAGVGLGPELAVMVLVAEALPVVLVARKALLARVGPSGAVEWYPAGRLLVLLTLYACALFLLAVLTASGEPGGLQGLVAKAVGLMVGEVLGGTGTPVDAAVQVAQALAEIFPGMALVSLLLMLIINSALAEWVLIRTGRALRPVPAMAGIAVPWEISLGFAGLLAGAAVLDGMPGYVCVNLALILALPLFFAGLAVVHAAVRRHGAGTAFLVVFYLILSLFIWPVVPVVMMGLVEPWAGLRRRLQSSGSDKGDV